ncbi:TPA: hypothetical protein HA274_00645 [Candidatus Bathyarchaeota archaeon]|nr:hypothetical protein [Candidatus Bathyarchaeota archaeon]
MDLGKILKNELILFMGRKSKRRNSRKRGRRMKQTNVHTVDLTEIDGNGDFSCPKCRAIISPDDTTEKNYSILDSKASPNGLEEVVIVCNLCGSYIHLTGFSLLKEVA